MKLIGFVLPTWIAVLLVHTASYAFEHKDFHEAEVTPNPYVGLSLAQIEALPEFVPIDEESRFPVPSSARESAEPGAPYAYNWVGYIDLPDRYVIFDSTGAGVTMVPDRVSPNDDAVPVWFVGTIAYLYEVGLLEGSLGPCG